MEKPPGSELQKQTLWLFGVLVGLAIKEIITGVYHHITEQQHFWGGFLEGIRLVVFLIVIVRFYLGAVQYFYAVYRSPNADTNYPNKSFRTDFLFGFGHFIIFCFLGLSATLHGSGWSLFPIVLAVVLSYDVAWYFSSGGLNTKPAIRLWMVINALTVCVAGFLFMVVAFGFMCLVNDRQVTLTVEQAAVCEVVAYLPVFIASIIDLGSVLHSRSAVEEWLAESIHRPKFLGGGQ
jgi:hypothetical protein